MARHLFGPGSDKRGAVAPLIGMSLIGLVAVGGIAFDYARLAAMDTELQNAADQAALAAASQLDKKPGACERAIAAAMTLVNNQTRFANDNDGLPVTITQPNICDDGVPEGGEPSEDPGGINFDANASIRFYQDKAKTIPADSDSNARFVEVTVDPREAVYSLTPIAAAFRSGDIRATAFAGLGSAICKVPPLMMCNPNPGQPFDPDAHRGRGLKLFMGGGNSWGPGAFGWLDVGAVNNGSPDQNIAIGMDNPNTNCVADAGVNIDTGVSSSVLDAMNVRFDIFQGNFATNTCFGNAACSPAANSTKDVIRMHPPSATACGIHDAQWRLPLEADQYIPSNANGDDSNVLFIGYPMDVCHYPSAGKSCGAVERFGDGVWRRDIYFATNHNALTAGGTNWENATGLTASATRYDVYRWEQNVAGIGNNAGSVPAPAAVFQDMSGNNNDGDYNQRGAPVCKPPGLPPSSTQPDRRVVAAAVGDNCDDLAGGSRALDVIAWAEVFLVQPSLARGNGPSQITSNNEIYVEIIGRANPTGSGATAQVVHRDVPYLIE